MHAHTHTGLKFWDNKRTLRVKHIAFFISFILQYCTEWIGVGGVCALLHTNSISTQFIVIHTHPHTNSNRHYHQCLREWASNNHTDKPSVTILLMVYRHKIMNWQFQNVRHYQPDTERNSFPPLVALERDSVTKDIRYASLLCHK